MLALAAAACAGDKSTPQSDAAATAASVGDAAHQVTGPSDAPVAASGNAVIGDFRCELHAQTPNSVAFTDLQGSVSDGPTPATVAWDLVKEQAGCRLLKPRAPFCDPRCASGKVCGDGNQCAAYPTAKDLGPVRVRGLGPAEFTMEAIVNAYALPTGLALPYPPSPEGTEIQLIVADGPYGAFTLRSSAIAPLAAAGGMLTLDEGKPLPLTWVPAGRPSISRIELKIDLSHHGGAKGQIACDVPDTGALEIPATLMTQLVGFGVAGYPTIEISRISQGHADVAVGRVRFRVISSVTREAAVPGITSCHETADCPTGKTCRPDLTCSH